MALPLQLPWTTAQTRWKSQLDPVISNPLLQGQLLVGVALANGTTLVNHGLGRSLMGWFLVGINGSAIVYDNQASNQSPQLTLSLTSNAAVTVNIWVF